MNAVPASVGDIDRRTYLGGSDAAAILGLDPYGKTPLTVYLAKRGELERGTPDPERELFLKRRKRWEEPIVAMLREEYEGEIVAVNARYPDQEHGFLAAEIDFEWRDQDGEIQNGEIKTVSPFAFNEGAGWGDAGTDQIPVHYACQVLHGLGVMRRKVCVVAALVGLDTMTFYRVERDEEVIAGLRAAEVSFWNDNVLAGVPPEPISMADVGRLWNRRNGRPVELDEAAAEAFEHLRQIREQLRSLEGHEAEAALAVAKFICRAWGVEEGADPPQADNAILTYHGKTLGKWAAGKGSHVDQRRLFADHPTLKEAYTVPHYFRTFRFSKAA